jgi:hypothetical protein
MKNAPETVIIYDRGPSPKVEIANNKDILQELEKLSGLIEDISISPELIAEMDTTTFIRKYGTLFYSGHLPDLQKNLEQDKYTSEHFIQPDKLNYLLEVLGIDRSFLAKSVAENGVIILYIDHLKEDTGMFGMYRELTIDNRTANVIIIDNSDTEHQQTTLTHEKEHYIRNLFTRSSDRFQIETDPIEAISKHYHRSRNPKLKFSNEVVSAKTIVQYDIPNFIIDNLLDEAIAVFSERNSIEDTFDFLRDTNRVSIYINQYIQSQIIQSANLSDQEKRIVEIEVESRFLKIRDLITFTLQYPFNHMNQKYNISLDSNRIRKILRSILFLSHNGQLENYFKAIIP